MGSEASDNPSDNQEQQGAQQGLNRREFLQKAGLVAGALGLSELALNLGASLGSSLGVSGKATAYTQAVAGPAGRKLALLIGVDNYPNEALPAEQTGGKKLAGCATDVALQRELLIHRFGFLPADIVCLTNEQATREGIYEAFVSHLYDQAQAGDVVVIHFSGYGSQISVEDLSGGDTQMRSLVPFNGFIPSPERRTLNDISEVELKTLLGQLKTKNITTVLDAGFVDISLPLSGGLRSRTRSEVITGKRPAPFDLLTNRRLAKESDAFPGTLLRGADVTDVVLERQWSEFSAGAFTYVLTQYLWMAPAPVTTATSLARSRETLLRWGGSNQQPVLSGSQNSSKDTPVYSAALMDRTRAEGVITEVSSDGKTATIWFGGLPSRVLEYLASPAVITTAGRRLKVRANDGLSGKAKLTDDAGNNGAPLQVGQPVFESIRALPKSPNLVVALDSRLERIERVDATSALSALSFVSSTSDTALPADCLLAKPTDTLSGTLTASLTPAKLAQSESSTEETPMEELGNVGYGLFSLTRTLIPGTLSLQEEAIKPAISRLSTKLRALMALKMLRLTENRAASSLPMRVQLEQVGVKENTLLIGRQTFKAEQLGKRETQGFTPEVAVGSRVRYRLFNDSDQPVYYTLINVDPRERLSAFCPASSDPLDLAASTTPDLVEGENIPAIAADSIAPGSSVAIPSPELDWAVELPTGPVETYVICTTRPLTNTFDLLLADSNNNGQRVSPLPNPLEVVRAILLDLNSGSDADSYLLDVTEWATLNFTYQAV
ncbi:MAG: caspase family protein [Cyanobacteria bacterium J06560_2]